MDMGGTTPYSCIKSGGTVVGLDREVRLSVRREFTITISSATVL